MKNIMRMAVVLGMLACGFCRAYAQEGIAGEDDLWPQTVTAGGTVIKVYQPQIDGWDGYTLREHAAVGVRTGEEQTSLSYGVAELTLHPVIDRASRTVRFGAPRFERIRLPSDPQEEAALLSDLRSSQPLRMNDTTLDRFESDLAILDEQKKGRAQPLRNDPPKIIITDLPSILVHVDGDPVYAPVKGTALSRVVNTRVLLLRDAAGKHYLRVFDGYMEAPGINGPWTVCRQAPQDVAIAEKTARDDQRTDLLVGEQDPDTKAVPSLYEGQAPRIFVSSVPAELLVTDGEPNYAPVDGTDLLYAVNTTGNLFKSMDDQNNYLLLSGRWFRSRSLNGPWEFVPASRLPEDFSRIPDDSPKENVKASVPGTPQAEEAAVADEVPTTARVDRSAPLSGMEIDGRPQLRPIEGTPLQYVFNCSLPLIRVDAETWYAVTNGVWYVADGPRGPWEVADHVPAVIYSIPVGSPLHYVTYVRVYDATPRYVYVGYTPGYYGTVVTDDGLVVYGTGYWYPAYVGRSVWYDPFYTYGWGSSLCWTPWYGWSFCFGFGGGWHHWYRPYAPWWGPYRRWHYVDHRPGWSASTAGNVYHLSRPGMPAGAAKVNAVPGYGARAYNSRTGALVTGRGLRPAGTGAAVMPHVVTQPRVSRTDAVIGGYGAPSRRPAFSHLQQSAGPAAGAFGHAPGQVYGGRGRQVFRKDQEFIRRGPVDPPAAGVRQGTAHMSAPQPLPAAVPGGGVQKARRPARNDADDAKPNTMGHMGRFR